VFDEATLQRFLDVLERRRVGIDVRRIFVLCSPLKMTIMAEVLRGFVKRGNPENVHDTPNKAMPGLG